MGKPGVLVVHNRYLEGGGEDTVVRAEIELLRHNGHRVLQYARHNREIQSFGWKQRAGLALATTWNHESYSEVRRLIRQERPDVVHCHNLMPLLSPSVYYACAAEGVPAVQSVHNYRLFCPSGNFFRCGEICEDCRFGLVNSLVHRCYRQSLGQTSALALMLGAHRALRTWRERVSAYIAPSEFCGKVLQKNGIPHEKIAVKPHFVASTYPPITGPGKYAVFVGRLSEEKGILQLLSIWKQLPTIPLMIIGCGPAEGDAKRLAQASSPNRICFTGQLSHDQIFERVREARFLLAPSLCYETFGLAVLEAAACGVPAVAARDGALHELISEHQDGLLFDPKDEEEAGDVIRWAWSHPLSMREMGRAARQKVLQKYSSAQNYTQLLDVYMKAINTSQAADTPSIWHMPAESPARLAPRTQN